MSSKPVRSNQFALVPRGQRLKTPTGWQRETWQKDWTLVHDPALPVREENDGSLTFGWRLPGEGGRWLRIRKDGSPETDACASLAAFRHSETGSLVSTMDLASDLGLAGPRRREAKKLEQLRIDTGTWHPAGLALHKAWRLLLPSRFSLSHGEVGGDPRRVTRFVEILQSHLSELADRFPLDISLTAGRDSRIVAAASRSLQEGCRYYVEKPVPPHRGPEVEISRALAEICQLTHSVGAPSDRERAVVFGFGGELARGHYWPEDESALTELPSAEALARTLGYLDEKEKPIPFLLAELESWLGTFPASSEPREIWDRLYLEQRMACTMSPLLYERDEKSAASFFGLGHPGLIELMLALSPGFRRKWKLADAVCHRAWPAMGLLPFNTLDYTASRRMTTLARLHSGDDPDFDRARRHPELRKWLSGESSSPLRAVFSDITRKLRRA